VDWDVPEGLDPGTNAVLRLVVTNLADRGFEAYSDPFTLQGLAVVAPVSNAVWTLGSAQVVSWSAPPPAARWTSTTRPTNGATFDAAAVAGWPADSVDGPKPIHGRSRCGARRPRPRGSKSSRPAI